MADNDGPSSAPEPRSGMLADPDAPILREHIRDVTRWVIGDAVGDQLTAGRCDELADELAAILASGLAPALRREIEHQTETTIEALQSGPLSFGHDHQLLLDGFTVPDMVKLVDAVGRLVDAGVTEAVSGLHETHQRMLYRAHDTWNARYGQPDAESEQPDV